jgi:hypothetical protein
MSKHVARNLALALLLVLLTGPANRAFASSTGQTSTSSTTSTTSTTTDGITGTDPEPIDPDVVSIILTFLGLG